MSMLSLPRSRRFLFDVQACQTASSAHRGVGRYSAALAEQVLSTVNGDDVQLLVSASFVMPDTYFQRHRHRYLALPALPAWDTQAGHLGGELDALDAVAYQSVATGCNADVLHLSHVFEGWGERVALPDFGLKSPGQVYSATLYDLIPLRFQEHYFQNLQFKRWYLSRLQWIRRADCLLAISEASRRDAIELLGIAPERIVTIYGGVGAHFQPASVAQQSSGATFTALRERLGILGRYVLYTGGDDYRKNIEGALRGFAALPDKVRQGVQFVIVCAMDDARKEMYRAMGRKAGLATREMVFTGFVSEADLVQLYQACALFVFPSLYEGLGLPVLEAMGCGAPVIASNSSSISELIALPEATFDPSKPSDIGQSMHRVLTDNAFASTLRSHGRARAQSYSWQRSATLAVEALTECSNRVHHAGVQVALSGWLPRRRLAVFSPLPPCRSGIADYNSRFLPFLARHFDIDLYVDGYVISDDAVAASYRVFNATDFAAAASAYDVVLYEFGNSEFHEHMLPLVKQYPGVVGLHDAYLSGLIGYLDFYQGDTGRYPAEMLAAHGPLARHYYAPIRACADPNAGSMINLPCIKSVLDASIGVISHSPFNLAMAARFHPEGWWAPFRVIPQMVSRPEPLTADARTRLRKALGFGANDIIICSFGNITWTKWGDRLVDAFAGVASLRDNARVHLVFAGELAADAFGHALNKAIKKFNLGKRIRITGYLSETDYEQYLYAADVAIQLRTKSRGGAPKGVLDCLAYGIPVVVNNDASYRDYPDDVVTKLSSDPTLADISQALTALTQDASRRRTLADVGVAYVRAHHDPELCAAKYAAAIEEFRVRTETAARPCLVQSFAPHIAGLPDSKMGVQLASGWLDQRTVRKHQRRRLLIDVSHIAMHDHETGIQRVVREIVCKLYCATVAGFDPVAVELKEGRLVRATGWLVARGLLMAVEQGRPDEPIDSFRRDDTLLMLDSSWARYTEFFGVFDSIQALGGRVVTAVYDLLPMKLPAGNFVEGGKEWFEAWFSLAALRSDGLVCISGAVANDVKDWIEQNQARLAIKRTPFVCHWHLGSDFAAITPEKTASAEVQAMKAAPYLLMVGTVEPRKSHAIALAAFERLWQRGETLALCIVGKEGWMVAELMGRIRSHPELGRRLFFFDHATDADVTTLYASATGLLLLSKGEGFGLPLIEAAQFGTPIICSDIPVFREIASNFAEYVNHDDPEILASQLADWARTLAANRVKRTSEMPRLSWQDSAHQLLESIAVARNVSALIDDYG